MVCCYGSSHLLFYIIMFIRYRYIQLIHIIVVYMGSSCLPSLLPAVGSSSTKVLKLSWHHTVKNIWLNLLLPDCHWISKLPESSVYLVWLSIYGTFYILWGSVTCKHQQFPKTCAVIKRTPAENVLLFTDSSAELSSCCVMPALRCWC